MKNLMNRWGLFIALFYAFAPSTSAQIDLETMVSINSSSFNLFEQKTVLVQVNNTSNQDATGVVVEVDFPSPTFFTTFSTIIDPSQGMFSVISGRWMVGSIPAQSSVFMTIKFQVLSETQSFPIFAQVVKADQMDVDSTPDNNSTGIPTEDDEGALNPTDDGSDDNTDNGAPSVEITTENELVTGVFNVQVNFSEPVGGFSISDVVVENAEVLAIYGGNQYYTLTVRPLPGDMVVLVVPANAATDVDGNSNTVSEPLFVEYLFESDYIDLRLDMDANKTSMGVYEQITYSLQISNSGTIDASNIRVAFGYDAQNSPSFAFISQNVSSSEYDSWNGVWKIDDLAAGDIRTLELTLFSLETASVTLFAEVLEADQFDIDSETNNGTAPTPNEDDEAATTVTISDGSMDFRIAQNTAAPAQTPSVEVRAFPNPTTDVLHLSTEMTTETMAQIVVSDMVGSVLMRQNWVLQEGSNFQSLACKHWQRGFYNVTVVGADGTVLSSEMIVKN